MKQSDPHVTAVLLDENTLSVDGVEFVRKSSMETMIRPVSKALAPALICVKCDFKRPYTYYFQMLEYKNMVISHCPGCGRLITGVLPWSGDVKRETP